MNDIFIGTELKLNLNIEPIGQVTMDDYDFEVEVYCSVKRAIVISKRETIRVDENNYILLVDTSLVGAGDLKCKVIAHVPDNDFEDGFRDEVIGFDTGINIIKHI